MAGFSGELPGYAIRAVVVGAVLLLAACSYKAVPVPGAAPAPAVTLLPGEKMEQREHRAGEPRTAGDVEIADLGRFPQEFGWLSAAAGDRLSLAGPCHDRLLAEFRSRFFAPWSSAAPAFDPVEAVDFMRHEGRATWYGPNRRKLGPKLMQGLLWNCALESFPSRNDSAITVAPGHLRGLPTQLPVFKSAEDFPFDMFSYPQVKLNEPLRVLHSSRDGVWLFVETGYTNGWIEARDVALVDRAFIDSWTRGPHLVVVSDYAPIPDGRGVGVFRSKVGTILPQVRSGEAGWEVAVASAGEGGRAQSRSVRIPRAAAAPFPLEFNRENISRVGDQFLGEPYGWGEVYDLRDCSAMLRDFFLPFGIWLPRTSADQIASLPEKVDLARMAPREKEGVIRGKGVPFLTLLYKPGHIMLYVGVDSAGRPLVFHSAWSVRLKQETPGDGAAGGDSRGERTQIIGEAAITSLEPGKELGLVPGGSLLERVTELGTIADRCLEPPRPDPSHPDPSHADRPRPDPQRPK